MPSNLRQQLSFDEPIAVQPTQSHYSTASSPNKKQKMSLSQTYFIAASARNKLGREAGRPDHDLRLLVGHANLLDCLMLELADAEREQEAWFNQTVRKAAKAEEPRHIQWVDTIDEEDDEEDDDSDSDSDSDFDEDFEMLAPLRRLTGSAVEISSREIDEDEDEDDYYDEEDDEEHALIRSNSASPPELVHDDDSDDEAMPPSPPQPNLEFTEKQREAIATTAYYEEKQAASLSQPEQVSFMEDGYFIPERNAPLIAAA